MCLGDKERSQDQEDKCLIEVEDCMDFDDCIGFDFIRHLIICFIADFKLFTFVYNMTLNYLPLFKISL